ncbi:inosine-uridine preferring nucleoside hydrolase-domain-containing protein [Endogone sp. FLAS-F59071]|nr:inosine-uridine preferring nucleoside hydrolase-domain-containing protein [Endogone sp. FLAS-F59071]|eukprot:RUS23081.1 inosine-uridine preferring nucleoside hydrolase-domain-containing protein [Endogone sp. FLAS-F59071]
MPPRPSATRPVTTSTPSNPSSRPPSRPSSRPPSRPSSRPPSPTSPTSPISPVVSSNPSSKRASLASIGASPPKEAITSPTDETVPKKTLVWLDCDPGHDDAMAIILAGYHPSIELLGISTVHGNQTLPKTTYNAASFLKASGLRHLKVVPGQAAPLVKFPIVANEIHGDSGLDGSTLLPNPDPSTILHSEKAVVYMAQLFAKQPRKITLVATGPLTNVALLLTLYPEVKSKIDKIVLMGGAIGPGNRTPVAEFNIVVDPEAAHIVLHSGLPIHMIPLDVTHRAIVTGEVLTQLRSTCAPDSKFCQLLVDLLLFYYETYKAVFGFKEGPPLHDPCAVAYVIDPSIFEVRDMRVEVVTHDGHACGQTICDIYNLSPHFKNVQMAVNIDPEALFDLMLNAWSEADSRSPLNDPENLADLPLAPADTDPLPYLRQSSTDNVAVTMLNKDGRVTNDIRQAVDFILSTPDSEKPRKMRRIRFSRGTVTGYKKTNKDPAAPPAFYTLDSLVHAIMTKDVEFSDYLMQAVMKDVNVVNVVDRQDAIEWLTGKRKESTHVVSGAGKVAIEGKK